MNLKEDTFVYNSAAYRTPEGSVVEELVKRLPGAEVSDDGTIKINGKEVKKILVDGKEFMTGDTKTALKNLPTSIIDKIKAYDEKSDLSKVTGIDDGEEQTVLDFGVKKGMNKGLISNIDLGVATRAATICVVWVVISMTTTDSCFLPMPIIPATEDSVAVDRVVALVVRMV